MKITGVIRRTVPGNRLRVADGEIYPSGGCRPEFEEIHAPLLQPDILKKQMAFPSRRGTLPFAEGDIETTIRVGREWSFLRIARPGKDRPVLEPLLKGSIGQQFSMKQGKNG